MEWLKILELILIGLGFIVINMIILFLNLKLYTEFFKERVKKHERH